MAPTIDQRHAIELRITELERLEGQRDVDRAMVRLSEMLVGFGQAATSEKVATMRARAYLVALEDLPWWAVEEACRMWLTGQAGDFNYSFAPSPPQLRIVALHCRDRVVYQRKALQRLLSAQVEREYTTEHRGEMLRKLADLFRGIGSTLRDTPNQRAATAAAKRKAVLEKKAADQQATESA